MKRIDGYDVVVVGGGPGGVGAAVAAAKGGAKTLLIEREGWLGGGATTMLVNPFMCELTSPAESTGVQRVVNAGLFGRIVKRLLDDGEGERWPSANGGWGGVCFNDETLKLILDELVTEAGVDVLFHTTLFDAEVVNGNVVAVQLAHNAGPLRVTGKVFIDSTGDGLLASVAGANVMMGDDEGAVMPMTLCFAIGGLDHDRMPNRHEMRQRCAVGDKDTPKLINTNFSFSQIPPNGLLYINAIRVSGNALDPQSLSEMEVEARRRVHNFVTWAKANLPGFEDCYLAKTGTHIGIRETRRIEGEYMLDYDDFKNCARFDDAIACCAYMLDTHGHRPGENRYEYLPKGEYYQIPYRCIVPKKLNNLLIGSRCFSATREVFSSARVMPPVMNLGEAAGFAAAMACDRGLVREVDVRQLQQQIRDNGGALEPWDSGLKR